MLTLKTFFEHAVAIGMEHDPRGKKYLQQLLDKQKKKMNKLSDKERETFDVERTWNPYGDCRILYGEDSTPIRHLMVGIDIETPEVLLADRLRERGRPIDALFLHHPEGRALADLEKVLPLQSDLLALSGVPITHSDALLRPRMERIWRSIHADNLFRFERAAEILDIPALVCHTITDNLAWRFMEKHVCAQSCDDLGEIIDAISEIPEYKYYAKKGNPPIIVNGSRSGRPGRVCATEFTGGTNGPEELMEAQSRAGVGTILSMHVTEKSLEEAKKHHLNMIQCSHMASDSLGINLLLDRLEKHEPRLEYIEVSGFIRVKRKVEKLV